MGVLLWVNAVWVYGLVRHRYFGIMEFEVDG